MEALDKVTVSKKSMVMGILGLFGIIPTFSATSMVLSILAIIFGKKDGNKAGFILGCIGSGLSTIGLLLAFIALCRNL